MQRLRILSLVFFALAGCDTGPDTAIVLSANAIVGGPEWTEIAAHDDAGVVKVELYFDEGHVGDAEIAPFVVTWNATPFTEGPHHLMARAYASDGRVGTASVDVWVDNTAPVVGTIDDTQVGVLLDLPVSDNTGLARVVTTADGAPFTLTEPPWQWAPPRCGPLDVTIEATDRAGTTTTRTITIDAYNRDDADCDGALVSIPPYDCNDRDPRVSPLATDLGLEPLDLDCDGVFGQDDDGDGVAAIGRGGDDCDDHDPAIHGDAYRWRTDAVPDADPGAAPPVIASEGAIRHIAFIAANGTLRYRVASATDLGGTSEGILAGTGIVPVGIVLQDGLPVIVARDPSGVVVAARSASGWRTVRLDSHPAVSDVATAIDSAGDLHIAWASSLSVFAARVSHGETSVEAIDTGTASDVAVAPGLDGVRHVLVVRGGAITDLRGNPGASIVALPVPSQRPVAEVAWGGSPFSIVVLDELPALHARSIRQFPWAGQTWIEPLAYAGRVSATAHHLLAQGRDVFVEADLGGVAPVVLRAWADVSYLSEAQPVAYAPLGALVANDGTRLTTRDGLTVPTQVVSPAPDGPDAIDRDCDGASD